MTEILINPLELQQVAADLRAVASEALDIAASLSSTCCCDMPPGTSGYVDAELASVGAAVADTAGAYGSAADELALRASFILDDQSMVSTIDAAFAAPADIAAGGSAVSLTDDWMGSMSIADGSIAVDDSFSAPTGDWLDGLDGNSSNPGSIELTGSWVSGLDTSGTGTSGAGDLTSGWSDEMTAANNGSWAFANMQQPTADWAYTTAVGPGLPASVLGGGLSPTDITNAVTADSTHIAGTYASLHDDLGHELFGTSTPGVLTDNMGGYYSY
jgi:hypothetical protein